MARWIGAPWLRRWRDPLRRLRLLGRAALSDPTHAPGGMGASTATGLDPDRDAGDARRPVLGSAGYRRDSCPPRDLARGRFRGVRVCAGGRFRLAPSADRYSPIGLGGRGP